jgi:hypothetical protein
MNTRTSLPSPGAGRAAAISLLLSILLLHTSATPVSAASYEWTFGGSLDASLGNGILEFADPATEGLVSFGLTDGVSVPNINGQVGSFLRVPAFTDPAHGLNLAFQGSGPNGGGAYINQYTFIFDLLSPVDRGWSALFNTDPFNSSGNDADFYIAPDGSVGIGALGYTAPGRIMPDQWHRIALTADLGAGTVRYYIDGQAVFVRTGSSLLDGRFALFSANDGGPDVRLFNEGDTTGTYTHDLLLAGLFFTDSALSPEQIGALGAVAAGGILVPEPSTWTLAALGAGALAFGHWRRRSKSPAQR